MAPNPALGKVAHLGWLGANELRWSPAEGAADYAVRVTDTRGQVRFQNTVKGTTIELPPTYSSKQQCLGWKEVGSRTSAVSWLPQDAQSSVAI